MYQKIVLVFSVALVLSNASNAQTKQDFNDPAIASATMGMLFFIANGTHCAPLMVKVDRFEHAVSALGGDDAKLQTVCTKCFETGFAGASEILQQKGEQAYCDTMVLLFGEGGTTFPGLVE